MGRKHTQAEVEARIERLEQAITTMGWSLAICRKIAKMEGITPDQVYRDRRALHAKWKKDAGDATDDEHRTEWLRRLQALGQQARKAGNFTAAIRALAEEGRALGYDKLWSVRETDGLTVLSRDEWVAQSVVGLSDVAVRALAMRALARGDAGGDA